jgi:hypothetical protein
MKTDYGIKLLETIRLSQRHRYLDIDGNLRIATDPMFNDEIIALSNLISKENKRIMRKDLENKGVSKMEIDKILRSECNGKHLLRKALEKYETNTKN